MKTRVLWVPYTEQMQYAEKDPVKISVLQEDGQCFLKWLYGQPGYISFLLIIQNTN